MLDFRPAKSGEGFRNFSVTVLVFLILVAVFIIGIAISYLLRYKNKTAKTIVRATSFIGLIVSLIASLYFALDFYTLVIVSAFITVSLAAGAIVLYCYNNKHKETSAVLLHCTAFTVFLLSFSVVLYALLGLSEGLGEWDPDPNGSGNPAIGYLIGFLSPAVVAGIAVALILSAKKYPFSFSTRDMTYAGVLLALAMALSYIAVRMPLGGRITLASSLPIMLYCYYFGFRKGAVVVCAFLAFQFIQGAYIIHPVQGIMDYVLPYAALITFAILNKKLNYKVFGNKFPVFFFIAGLIYAVIRYFSHVFAGYAFFSDTVPAGWGLWSYLFAYNTFFLLDAAIALIAGALLLASKVFNAHFEKVGGSLVSIKAGTDESGGEL